MSGSLGRLFHNALWRIQGIQVLALVGKSGTGKSFRAQLIAEKHRLSHIVDDGLLISGKRILAGISAKDAPDYMTAVRTAVFEDPEHRQAVRDRIQADRVTGLLLLGTSEKMIELIRQRLDLPPPSRIIRIEEVSSPEERESARADRLKGRHVIPVPAVEVRKNTAQLIIDGIKVLIGARLNWLRRRRRWEKTVVRPPFHQDGKVTISPAALKSLVLHCLNEFGAQIGFESCKIRQKHGKYSINLYVSAVYGLELQMEVPRLQAYVKDSIERFTGLTLEGVNIEVIKIL